MPSELTPTKGRSNRKKTPTSSELGSSYRIEHHGPGEARPYRILVAASTVKVVKQPLPPPDPSLVFTSISSHYDTPPARKCTGAAWKGSPHVQTPAPRLGWFLSGEAERIERERFERLTNDERLAIRNTRPPRPKELQFAEHQFGDNPGSVWKDSQTRRSFLLNEDGSPACPRASITGMEGGIADVSIEPVPKKQRRRSPSPLPRATELVIRAFALAERGLSQHEIATELDVTRRQVQTLLMRAGQFISAAKSTT